METVMLGNQGQLVLPEAIRSVYQWIKPVSPFPVSQLEPPDTPSVYQGAPLTLEEMEKAIDIEAGKHK
jgi:hypothetical protein